MTETKRYTTNELVWFRAQGKIGYGTVGNCTSGLQEAIDAGMGIDDLRVNDEDLTWGLATFEQGDEGVTDHERAGIIDIVHVDTCTVVILRTDDGTVVPNP